MTAEKHATKTSNEVSNENLSDSVATVEKKSLNENATFFGGFIRVFTIILITYFVSKLSDLPGRRLIHPTRH